VAGDGWVERSLSAGTNWEGGIRTPTFVTGGVLGPANRGKLLSGLVHSSDWFAVFAAAAVGFDEGRYASAVAKLEEDAAERDLPPVDAIDVWQCVSSCLLVVLVFISCVPFFFFFFFFWLS
jgi:hypothetical protein